MRQPPNSSPFNFLSDFSLCHLAFSIKMKPRDVTYEWEASVIQKDLKQKDSAYLN